MLKILLGTSRFEEEYDLFCVAKKLSVCWRKRLKQATHNESRWGESVLSESVWNMLQGAVRKKLLRASPVSSLTLMYHGRCSECQWWMIDLLDGAALGEIVLLLVRCWLTYLLQVPENIDLECSVWNWLNWPISYIGRVMIFSKLHPDCYYRWNQSGEIRQKTYHWKNSILSKVLPHGFSETSQNDSCTHNHITLSQDYFTEFQVYAGMSHWWLLKT